MNGENSFADLIAAAVMAGDVETHEDRVPQMSEPAALSGINRQRKTWTEEESAYVRANYARLGEEVLAARLGRTAMAIHIRKERELKLPAPLKDPDYISGYKLARKLGLNEPRKVGAWIRAGILAGELVPYRDHDVSRVRKDILLKWIVTPESWLYFHPERVADPILKRLVEEAVQGWGDEWWTLRQAADYHGIERTRCMRNAVKDGRLRTAVQVRNLSGRNDSGRWALWFVRRSEAVAWNLVKVFHFREETLKQMEARLKEVNGETSI
jgi:hypothetical protein